MQLKTDIKFKKIKRGLKNIFGVKATNKIKKEKVLAAQKLFSDGVLVETGTYLGEMIQSVKKNFSEIYSIELSDGLALEAVRRFKRYPHIHIINGDSGMVLENLLKSITSPAVFWLDAHYSAGITVRSDKFGDTPIIKELELILSNWKDRSAILIDDARLFTGKNGYPTIDAVRSIAIKRNDLKLRCFVDSDIIHIF